MGMNEVFRYKDPVFRDNKCLWVGNTVRTERSRHCVYRTSCGREDRTYHTKYRYCPYCGKPIITSNKDKGEIAKVVSRRIAE